MPAKVKGIKQRVQEQNLSTMRLVVRIAAHYYPTLWPSNYTSSSSDRPALFYKHDGFCIVVLYM